MSRNYDNWEKLVAAVLKREKFRQLCRQDSISTACSDSGSISTIFSADPSRILGPVALGKFDVTKGLKLVQHIGAGEFAATYLAQLSQHVQQYSGMGRRAVVKWLNKADLTEHKFKNQMTVLGNCRHENVTTPGAYYYSKMRKLIVYHYYTQGSVFDLLKDKGRELNWESRVKIAVGAARGITHIHAQSLTHGNIKLSNIFINGQGYGCVSEFGLAGMMKMRRSVGEKCDVSSFGVLLLQLVSGECESSNKALLFDRLLCFEPYQGRFDNQTREHAGPSNRDMREDERERFRFVDSRIDISVESVRRELEKTLQVAKRCLAPLPEARPSMNDVVLMVDNIPDSGSHHHHPLPVENKPVRNRFLRFGR